MANSVSENDVRLSLLSLDSYSRGKTNQAIQGLRNTFGGVVALQNSSDYEAEGSLVGAANAGFSAQRYSFGNETIIAYRGTDFDFSSVDSVLNFAKDFINGWLVSGNAADPASETGQKSQYIYAQEFYQLVTGNSIFAAGDVSNITITGHFLGGSLADLAANDNHP